MLTEVLLALALTTTHPATDGDSMREAIELLRASDLSTLAPAEFRATFRVASEAGTRDVEVWRDGPDRSLVRVLDAAETGRAFLRVANDLFLIAPRAKKPVRVGHALRLRGAAIIDFVTGIAYARDYDIAGATPSVEGGRSLVTLDLRRRKGVSASLPARIGYVVDVARKVPVRIESFLPSGKRGVTLELSDWTGGKDALAATLSFTDHLQQGARTQVTLSEHEIREIPDGLFSLTDSQARGALLLLFK